MEDTNVVNVGVTVKFTAKHQVARYLRKDHVLTEDRNYAMIYGTVNLAVNAVAAFAAIQGVERWADLGKVQLLKYRMTEEGIVI